MNTEEETKLTETQASNDEENVVNPVKMFLFGLAGLAIFMAIFTLLPMLFTYFSEGSVRAPSQIHPADPVGKSDKTIYEPIKSKK